MTIPVEIFAIMMGIGGALATAVGIMYRDARSDAKANADALVALQKASIDASHKLADAVSANTGALNRHTEAIDRFEERRRAPR